jgi:hypothetical protein
MQAAVKPPQFSHGWTDYENAFLKKINQLISNAWEMKEIDPDHAGTYMEILRNWAWAHGRGNSTKKLHNTQSNYHCLFHQPTPVLQQQQT